MVGLLTLLYITLNALTTHHPGSRGLPAGTRLPRFAAPLVHSSFPDDAGANVATPRNLNREAGRVPACEVRGAGAFNVCDAVAHRPLVLTFFTPAVSVCVRALDSMERLARAFRGVSFAAVSIGGDRGGMRRLVRSHGWSFPVAYDHDLAVTNLYGVAICPTVVLAYPGGRVMKTVLGDGVAQQATLGADVRRLVAGSRVR